MTTQRDRSQPAAGEEPAYYARPRLLRSRLARDWWVLLHPPYTLWHLSYVVIGACLLAPVNATILVATLLAFFLAVGVGAHALDELHGRPLRTELADWTLIVAATLSICGAAALGIVGIVVVDPWLGVFVVVGTVVVVGYNLELFDGRLHSDHVFALGWGSFPVLTAYFAQHGRLSAAAVTLAAFAYFLSVGQRRLSTPARGVRRRTRSVEGTIERSDGTFEPVTSATILRPLEDTLRALSWAVVALATALALAQFGVG